MQNQSWTTTLFISFLFVSCANALLASCTKVYYKNKALGHLSHSQLRIRQGTAGYEHRLNVFTQTLVFSFLSLRIYVITLLVWLVLSGAYQLSLLIKQ